MNCKKCGALLEEGVTLCPACGCENAEAEFAAEETAVEETVVDKEKTTAPVEEEVIVLAVEHDKVEKGAKSGTKPWVIFLTALAGVMAGVILVCAVLYATGVAFRNEPETEVPVQTEPTEAVTDPTQEATTPTVSLEPSGKNDIFNKVSYTVADEEADQWTDLVVAKVGDLELTNAQLQLCYWSGVIDFLNNYSYYLSSMGLDYTQPLDQQVSFEGDTTWEQFFLEMALLNWHKYAALAQTADAENFEMSEEGKQFAAEMKAYLESALEGTEFETVADMLKADMGVLCTEDGYYAYMETYNKALEYFDKLYVDATPTDEEVLKYFQDNEGTFDENGITMESGKYYDVRHILLKPQGGETDENGNTTYTDEEWAACLAEAQALLDQWKETDGTEAGFAALAVEHSTDSGSAANGGQYTNLTKDTNFVTEFKEWYMDESRQPGDTGIVKTAHGYHIMFFTASSDIWYLEASSAAHQENANKLIEQLLEQLPMDVTYANIAIGFVTLG